ncbi:MAG: radical SAM family heme chaperone HemW [Pyrinomonadaceae bacterium]
MAAGVYLHIPFCKSRCSYCDFATDVYRTSEAVERYVSALSKEIATFATQVRTTDDKVDAIYFGGGTPSLLNPDQVSRILDAVGTCFDVIPAAEITMEMNPATVTAETLAVYKILGVNRASFGVQTFNDRDLKLLARGHNSDDARHTFQMLRDAGYQNISFDLIIGLPDQSLGDWDRNLDEAWKMDPEHLSLYLLEIHEGTPLAEQIRSERRPLPDEELGAHMYELMLEKIKATDFEQYEISNFSKPGFESRHNTKYWRLEPVYGFGVSAHSFNGRERYANDRDTSAYVNKIENDGTAEVMRETTDAALEFIFLGLRLNRGIDLAEYGERFDIDLMDRHSTEIYRLEEAGLINLSGRRMSLTEKGMLFSTEVFAAFV